MNDPGCVCVWLTGVGEWLGGGRTNHREGAERGTNERLGEARRGEPNEHPR